MALIVGAASAPGRCPETAAVRAVDRIAVNDNRTPAGTMANGVLTVRLEVREGEWHPDRDTDPGLLVRAFAEFGKTASIPGPLIRVPEGTEIHAFVRNSLSDSTLIVHELERTRLEREPRPTPSDQSGAVREVRFVTRRARTSTAVTSEGFDHPALGPARDQLASVEDERSQHARHVIACW
jgi:hypothetical protein